MPATYITDSRGTLPPTLQVLDQSLGQLVTTGGRGERAATAGNVLERTGRTSRTEVLVMPVGPNEWAQASMTTVEVTA